jgi:hypothetical protein
MMAPNNKAQAAAVRPVATAAEAQQLIDHLGDVMDALLGLVEEETEFVRAGKVGEVAKLEPTKADLARLYLADTNRLKASKAFLAQTLPQAFETLRRRHDSFHALLQINLTVLATAHAVSEGIIRGVSAEMAQKTTPQTYGASGRTATMSPRKASQPLMVSRSL